MKLRTILAASAAAAATTMLAIAPSPAKADHLPCVADWHGDITIRNVDDRDIHTKHYADPGKVEGTCGVTP